MRTTQIDPTWWTSSTYEGRPMREILRRRDIPAVFRFLASRGWSRAAIAAATGLSESRVRGIRQGRQQITSYDVLERIADGLGIQRGLIGLAYTDDPIDSLSPPLVARRVFVDRPEPRSQHGLWNQDLLRPATCIGIQSTESSWP